MLSKRILVLMFLLLFLPLVGCFAPQNQTPILTSSPITTATVGVEYTYDVNATDPNGDTLTYSLATPGGMTINSATGLIKWTPATAQIGDNPVTVKVSDGSLSIIQSFTIKVDPLPAVNQAPVIISTPVTIATVGITYFYDVNATDPNGDILIYSLTAWPGGMVISSANGLIMWTPIAEGAYAVVVNVSDGSLSDTQGFTIVVSKPTIPPKTYTITASAGSGGTISPLGDVTVSKGTNIGFTINPNTDYNIADVLVNGGSVGAVASHTFINVAKDHTIHATFIAVEPEPEPEIELTGIVVDPKTMDLFVGGEKTITSVTATYEIKGTEVTIALGECDYVPDPTGVVTVDDGLVEAIAEGTTTITVGYGGETDTLEVTVEAVEPGGPVHNITKDLYYDTIQEAIDGASAGNTIEVMAGIYTPSSTITINKNNLTLIGPQADVDPRPFYGSTRAPGSTEEAVIDGDSISTKYIIFIDADNVVINGFEVRFGLLDGMIYQINPHSGTVVKYNIIHDSDQDEGVQLKECTNGVIEYNYVYNTAGDALNFAYSQDCIIRFNEVHNADDRTVITWGGAIYTYQSTNIDIIGNRIYDTCSHGIAFGGVVKGGIIGSGWPDYRNDGGNVEGNIIYNVVGDGLWLLSDNTTVKDNEIYDCSRNGIQIIGENIVVQDNELYNNDVGILVEDVAPILSTNVSAHFNNIVGNTGHGINSNFAVTIVNATYNWWGGTGGPGIGGNNGVVGTVDFNPWSTTPH